MRDGSAPRVDEAATTLLAETAPTIAEDFLIALCRATTRVLGVKHAFVGRVDDPDAPKTVQAVARWSGNAREEPFAYPLEGTPCEQVITRGTSMHIPEVRQESLHLPPVDDPDIVCYAAIPIRSHQGVVGLLAALHNAPLVDPPDLDATFELLATRAGAELERLATFERLTESEARYRRMVMSIQEGIWMIDADARTTFSNPRMAEMLGYRDSEMLGRSMYEFMDAAASEEASRNEARRKSGIAEHHPFRLRRRDGSDLWVTMAANPIVGPGGVYQGALAIVTDRTAAKRLDERMQQSQKLESLSALSSGIAHDFNNLLTSVLGNVDLALTDAGLPSSLRPVLEQAKTASLRAASLTRQLLAYAGRGAVNLVSVSTRRILVEASQLLATTVPKGARLAIDVPEDDHPVRGDEAQMLQVILNLVINAGEALIDGHGSIRVTTRGWDALPADVADTSFFGLLAPGPYVEISVTDDGCGMDSATAERVFDPFFSTKATGRGLGLAGVAGIVRRHGGSIAVDSAPGKGTAMRVYLPAATDAPPASERPTEQAFRRGAGTVLVIDDEDTVRLTVRRMLERAGYDVEECSDGTEGLSRLLRRADTYAFVILDVAMPGLDGAQVLKRARNAGIDVPIVVVSGHSQTAIDAPMADRTRFVGKPFSLSQLLEAARKATS